MKEKRSSSNGEPLRDRIVLVTGAASGIGRATAFEFQRAGARIALLDVEAGALRAVEEGLAAEAREEAAPLALVCDLRAPAELDAAVDRLLAAWGRIDVLINNAGLLVGGPFQEGDLERIRDVIEVNFQAPVRLTHRVLPGMIERGSGHVLNMISSSALLGVPGYAAYAATKSGLVGFTRILRRELAGSGVRLTTLCPGSTTSGMTHAMQRFGRGAGAQPHHPPEVPAAAMLDAVVRGREHVLVTDRPVRVGLVTFLDRVFPRMMNGYWEKALRDGDWIECARLGGAAEEDR